MYQRNGEESISPSGLDQTGRLVRSIQSLREMDPKEKLATALTGLEPGAPPAAVVKTALIFEMDARTRDQARTAYATAKVPSSYFTDDADANEKAYGDALQEFDSVLNNGPVAEQSLQKSNPQPPTSQQPAISGEQLSKVGIASRSISAMLGQGSKEKVATALKGLEPDDSRAAVMKTAILFALQPNVQEQVGISYANKKVPSSYFGDDADENERAYASALEEYDSILKHGAGNGPQNTAVSLGTAAQTNGTQSGATPSQSPTAPTLKSILKADGAPKGAQPKNVTFGPNSTKLFTKDSTVGAPAMPTGQKPKLLPKPTPVSTQGSALGATAPLMPTGEKPKLLPKPTPAWKGNGVSNASSAQAALLGQNLSAPKAAPNWREGHADQSQPHLEVSKSSPGSSSHRLK